MEKDTTMEVIEFLAKTGHFLFAGWILMLVWNEIAYLYNQPEFGYWVCVGIYWLIHCFTSPFSSHKKS